MLIRALAVVFTAQGTLQMSGGSCVIYAISTLQNEKVDCVKLVSKGNQKMKGHARYAKSDVQEWLTGAALHVWNLLDEGSGHASEANSLHSVLEGSSAQPTKLANSNICRIDSLNLAGKLFSNSFLLLGKRSSN